MTIANYAWSTGKVEMFGVAPNHPHTQKQVHHVALAKFLLKNMLYGRYSYLIKIKLFINFIRSLRLHLFCPTMNLESF